MKIIIFANHFILNQSG